MKSGFIDSIFAVIVVTVMALSTVCAKAEGLAPDVVGLHIGSWHTSKVDHVAGRPWNNYNPGIYARWDNIVVGTYLNSIRKQSYYVGYAYPLFEHVDIVLGVVSGYSGPGYKARPVMPMVIPSIHFPISDSVHGRINIAFGIGKGSATAVNFAVEYRFP